MTETRNAQTDDPGGTRVALRVNGRDVTVDSSHPHLLAALRDNSLCALASLD